MCLYIEIQSLLIDIEAELRRLRQWDDTPPPPEALSSTEPFCVDTLSFSQWLQFIFLPRMSALAAARQLPPGRCELAPMAEEYFRGSNLDAAALIRHIDALDRLVNGGRALR